MSTAIGILVTILLLFVAVWLAVFGGVGALLAPRRGRTRMSGFLWGALLGPIGWIVLLIRPGSLPRALGRPVAPVLPPPSSPTSHDSDVGYF